MEGGRFFLHAAGIGQHQVATPQQGEKAEIIHGRNQVDALHVIELAHDRVTDIGVHVNGIDHPDIRKALYQVGDCAADILQFRAP